MQTGRVAVDDLNVRDKAITGAVRAKLSRGRRIDIIAEKDGWFEIRHQIAPAFVKGSMVELLTVPGDLREDEIKISGKKVFASGGVQFATLTKLGVANSGKTRMDSFIGANPGLFATMSASLQRVARAVSVNEGALEAINTWDNAFLSFGIFQWTSGPGSDPGELPAMLARLKLEDGDAFAFYFGRFGLDLIMPATAGATSGQFSLNGTLLAKPADKEALRTNIWAYRFWRAGHDPSVRKAEIGHALDRIGAFYDKTGVALKGKRVRDWVTSELGVAQLLDQHVNRPGHVVPVLGAALEGFLGAGGNANPASWGDAQETALLKRYLAIRATFGSSPMTSSDSRAAEIAKAVSTGKLSAKRGSFAG